jgi:plastocyanin
VLLSLIGIGGLANGFPEYAAVRPAEYVPFSSIILQYAAILMVDVAAVVKLTRRQAPTMPAWLAQGIGVLAGLVLGALLIGAAAQPVSGGGATAKETVHLTPLAFAPDTVSVHTGDSLTVIDDSPTPHILANGTWTDGNKPAPGAEPGAPTISNVELNNNTVKIGPFPTAGVYHIYCTVHPGMSLTVVVQ